MKRFLLFMFHPLLVVFAANSGTINYSIKFDFDSDVLSDTIVNGESYINIQSGDKSVHMIDGQPMLPYKQIMLSVPFNSDNFQITATALGKCKEIILNYKILPFIPEITGEQSNELDYSIKNRECQTLAQIEKESFIGGFNRIVTLNIFPYQYYTEENILKQVDEINISLSFDEIKSSNKAIQAIYSYDEDRVNENIAKAKNLVCNPESIEVHQPDDLYREPHTRELNYSKDAEYVIVTSAELSDSFQRLAAFRRLKGMSAKIYSIEEILEDSRFIEGDIVSNLNDDAGKLRAFLSYCYQYLGTKYVLLGGLHPKIPTRFCLKEMNGSEGIPYTDLYYGDLNSSWENLVPEKSGTSSKTSDDDCELYIGRICVRDTTDVCNYINKVIDYEMNPGDYVMNACVTIINQFSQHIIDNNSNNFVNLYDQIFEMDLIKQENPNVLCPNGNDIIEILNEKSYGYVDFLGHGDVSNVCVSYINNENIYPRFKCITATNAYTKVNETCNGLDNWNNAYRPNWSHSLSCRTMPFYDISDSTRNLKHSFVDSYLFGGNYGGVAFIGNNNTGELRRGASLTLSYFSKFKEQLSSTDYSFAGQLMSDARRDAIVEFYYKCIYNLGGDPAIHLWNQIPTTIDCDYDLLRPHPIIPDTLRMAIVDINNHVNPYYINRESDKIAITRIYGTDLHIFYAPNLIPYIQSINIDYNVFTGKNYIFTGDVIIGQEDYKADAEVIFESDADITIESLGIVEINHGTKFEPGARLKIISNSSVSLSDIEIPENVTLEITASDIVLDRYVSIHENANFIYTGFVHHY